MGEFTYRVVIDNSEVAGQNMPLRYALKLAEKLFEDYYNEPEIKVTIEREAKEELTVSATCSERDGLMF